MTNDLATGSITHAIELDVRSPSVNIFLDLFKDDVKEILTQFEHTGYNAGQREEITQLFVLGTGRDP